jgi:hypothetical protein
VDSLEHGVLVSETRVSEELVVTGTLDLVVHSVGKYRGQLIGTALLGTVINKVPRRRPPPEPPPEPHSWKTPPVLVVTSPRLFSSSELVAISRAVSVANRFRRVLHPRQLARSRAFWCLL